MSAPVLGGVTGLVAILLTIGAGAVSATTPRLSLAPLDATVAQRFTGLALRCVHQALEDAAVNHALAALPHVTGEHYEGGHWLGTFAVYLSTHDD